MLKPRPKPQSSAKGYGYLALATEIGALLGLWLGLGYLLQRYTAAGPLALLLGGLVGVAHALWHFIRRIS
ncbi:MAG: hypothetical protein NZ958_04550 [Bacteroidia bacterium]|nr:hypothetical protein [Bacteroidia bacterium]MDW8089751.1 hypothetical protein [Bacteroidia bacterium]